MVSAVLVNYRQPALTEQAVRSLRRAAAPDVLQVIVVDNCSGDGSVERLRRCGEDVVVLEAGSNRGFSAGCNIGIRHALSCDSEAVLLVNNDTEVETGFLGPLVESMRRGRTISVPKITFADDPSRIWYGGGRVDRGRGGFYHDTDARMADTPRDVDFASGCCMLVPSSFFAECGLMDESYFLYYEDAELCMRARSHGYNIRYVPSSVVRHKVGASTGGESSPLASYYGTRNRLEVLRRYGFPARAFLFVLASRFAKVVLCPHRLARLRGVLDFFRGRMSNLIVVNGVFAGRRASGLERFAVETLRALDEIAAPGRFRLLVPRYAKPESIPSFRNIEVVRRGVMPRMLWEQWTLPRYARRADAETLSLTNTVPVFRPGFACIHDVFYVTHANDFRRSLKGRMAMWMHRVHYCAIVHGGKGIFTVSEYSRRQIAEVLRVPAGRIMVLGNGWEHVLRIVSDDTVLKRHPELVRGKFLLALGNLSPYKNLAWVMAAARKRPEIVWAVAGGKPRSVACAHESLGNVVFLGYVSDGEMRALMENCMALVHPSLDEGFGIPPLEALSLGRPAIVARSSCLPEIYGDAVRYIEHPDDIGNADISPCLIGSPTPPDKLLFVHTWKNVAKKLNAALTASVGCTYADD